MRRIQKGAEPPCLDADRRAGRGFGDLGGTCKQLMREALVREQGSLCCYCMARIRPNEQSMSVEHLVAQSDPDRGAALAMDWANMFGVCDGGRGNRRQLQHCDASKHHDLLSFAPSDVGFEDQIRYRADGNIDAATPTLRRDLVETLNLNTGYLPANRKATLDAFLEQKQRLFPGAWDRARVDRFIDELSGARELMPFVRVILHFLYKRRARC